MSMTASHQHFRDQHCDFQADQASMEALLNCYCRDIAQPADELSVHDAGASQMWPQALRIRQALDFASILQISFPDSEDLLLIAIAGDSRTCNYRYLSPPYLKSSQRSWRILGLEQLARLILNHLADRFDHPFNGDLYRQILLSRRVMATALAYSRVPQHWGQGLGAFRWSEQSLCFGHRFHPAPKSREGFDAEDILQYSPELGAGFALFYFAVKPEDVLRGGELKNPADLAATDTDLDLPEGMIPLPVHPWQARYLMRQPLVRSAIRSGRLVPLGQAGPRYYPTASVRTLYNPGAPFFLKFSTHVRLTNCVRKNAVYELNSAVTLSSALKAHLEPSLAPWPGFRLLYEPGFQTLDFSDLGSPDRRFITEGFGVILRDNVEQHLSAGVTPLLAAALFTEDRYGLCPATEAVRRWAGHAGLPEAQASTAWFEQYLNLLVPPLLEALFHQGVVFEPHLQNVVVGLRDGYPVQVFVRDLEGTKLVPDRWSGTLPDTLAPDTLASIHYSPGRAWKRVAYCLLVNHLFQVVACLSQGTPDTEARLWSCLARVIGRWLADSEDAWANQVLGELLAGAPIPNKSNLLTRVFKRADRDSDYTWVTNPLPPMPRHPIATGETSASV